MASTNRIVFLDYLRVFAFMSVLIGHKLFAEISNLINIYPTIHITQQYISNFTTSLFMGGGAGVIVFFMISGYIILHVSTYEKPIEFLIKRFFRIYPLLIFAIIFEVFLQSFLQGQSINYVNVLIQFTLLGDFFNTPYALAGVEWTLRVEIMFYLLVSLISFLKIQHKPYLLLLVFIGITILLKYISPFPTNLFVSYFTIYFPFLFLGSAIYLYEQKKINLLSLVIFVIFVFENYFKLINEFHKGWLTSNFAIAGFLVFILLWLNRDKLENFILNKFIIFVSGLTYSVYLFHNYLWFYIGKYLGTENKFLILFVLLIFCYIVTKIIETPMNKLGKTVVNKLKKEIAK